MNRFHVHLNVTDLDASIRFYTQLFASAPTVVKADYAKDRITYKVPNRCAGFDLARGYVDTYASARKYKPAHWDEGSPASSTGDWFDTTYDLVVPR